jgi:hypothetical protein
MDTKQCLLCAEHKPLDAFSTLKTGRGRVHPWCRECLNQYFRDRRAGAPTKKRAAGVPLSARRVINTARSAIFGVSIAERATGETYEKLSGIYRIVHKPTGHAYIGASTDLEQRFILHLSALRTGNSDMAFIRDLLKQNGPEAFAIEVLAFCPKEELKMFEKSLWERRVKERTSLNDMQYYRGGSLPKT